jgi:hypothetical protein
MRSPNGCYGIMLIIMEIGSSTQTHYSSAGEQASVAPVQNPEDKNRRTMLMIGLVVGAVIFLGLIVAAIIYLASPGAPTERIRDIFIIFMALEFLVIGLALVILIIQLASLINLLQNEVKPILESTNETASTLRGTAVFISENLTQPVIQLNSYIAAMRRMVELLGITRKQK